MKKENKINSHAQKTTIEQIILSCKFSGHGSTVIANEIKAKVGLTVTRPTIDNYYKNFMNGDILTALIKNSKENTSDQQENGKVPAYDSNTVNKVHDTLIDVNYHVRFPATEIREVMQRSVAELCGLIDGNIKAHIKGEERLKTEYLKYMKELQNLNIANYQLTRPTD